MSIRHVAAPDLRRVVFTLTWVAVSLFTGFAVVYVGSTELRLVIVALLAIAGLIGVLAIRHIETLLTLSLIASLFYKLPSLAIDAYWLPVLFDLVLLAAAALLVLLRSGSWHATSGRLLFLAAWLIYFTIALLEMFNPNIASAEIALQGLRVTAFQSVAILAAMFGFRSKAAVERLWLVLAVVAIPILLNGIRQLVVRWPIDLVIIAQARSGEDPFWLGNSGLAQRAFSIFPSPFVFGMLGNLVAVIALYFALTRRSVAWYVVAGIATVAAMSSLTRSTLFALVVSALVFLVMAGHIRLAALRRLVVPGMVLLTALMIVVLSVPALSIYVGTVVRFWEEPHFVGRVEQWGGYLQLIAESPFVGWGVGSAGDALGYLWVGLPGVHVVTHNLLLKLLMETGIFGTTAFVLIFAIPLLGWLRARIRTGLPQPQRYFLALHLAMVASILVQGLTGSGIEAFPVNVWFWLAIGFFAREVFRARGEHINNAEGPADAPRPFPGNATTG